MIDDAASGYFAYSFKYLTKTSSEKIKNRFFFSDLPDKFLTAVHIEWKDELLIHL